MTQETLPLAFAVDISPAEPAIPGDESATPPLAFADPEDAALWAAGLPCETRVNGQRVCRHHGLAPFAPRAVFAVRQGGRGGA